MKIQTFLLLVVLIQSPGYSQMRFTGPGNVALSGDYQINEKILLETDREFYMVGEEINIACLLYEPLLQTKLDLSKVIYVDFYTSGNLVIDQVKIAVDKGIGSGFLKIPKRLSSGKYYVRAYTNYMKNLGCEGFSYCSVTVLNPFLGLNLEEPKDTAAKQLRNCMVYPEGGQVVYGCSNTVSCAFTDMNGNPVSCTARLIDNNDQVITTFFTNGYGLGSFIFSPVENVHYRLEASAGTTVIEKSIEIPEHAVTLSKVSQDSHELKLGLKRYRYTETPLQLEVNCAGYSVILRSLTETDSVIILPVSTLPKGIIQFRLRDSRNEILSYRNIYNAPVQHENLKINTNKEEYANREPVELVIENLSEGTIDALSVSVFMIENKRLQEYLNFDSQEHLQSVLYPFLGGSPYPAREVMLNAEFLEQVLVAMKITDTEAEGSPKSAYSQLTYFPEKKQDLIFGRVVDDHQFPVASSVVIQTWIDTVSVMQTAKTNDEGKFFFGTGRTGENRLILTQPKGSMGKLVLQEEFFPEFFSLREEKISINPENSQVMKQQLLNLQINDSFYEKRTNTGRESILPFYRAFDRNFYMADYVPLPTLEEFLFEVVPGIIPYHAKNKTIIRMPFPMMDESFGDDPLFLVDGVPVFDADLIGKLKCVDLLSVGVVYEKYFYQHGIFDGILDIHTRLGNASSLSIPENVYSLYFTGIQEAGLNNNISVPDANSREPFFKTQLYWNPSVALNLTGKTALTFSTPDNTGDYLIRCCLKSADGSVAYFYKTFTVR